MTYSVFGGTLNPTLLFSYVCNCVYTAVRMHRPNANTPRQQWRRLTTVSLLENDFGLRDLQHDLLLLYAGRPLVWKTWKCPGI